MGLVAYDTEKNGWVDGGGGGGGGRRGECTGTVKHDKSMGAARCRLCAVASFTSIRTIQQKVSPLFI